MLGLTHGEFFIVAFVVVAVVSARYWPKVGERLALLAAGKRPAAPDAGGGPDSGSA